eukprot:754778-Hanusia_phi.AAC.1
MDNRISWREAGGGRRREEEGGGRREEEGRRREEEGRMIQPLADTTGGLRRGSSSLDAGCKERWSCSR